jgi:hypothetical protein
MHVGKWVLAVDRRATQAAYRNERPISACVCDYCQNYFAACRANVAHSPATLALFQSLGIDPEKEAEIYTLFANPEKTHALYDGFYHFVGRLVETGTGPQYAVIDDLFQVAFTERNSLLSPQFSRPAVQMEFRGFVPWVLEEKRAALDAPSMSLTSFPLSST